MTPDMVQEASDQGISLHTKMVEAIRRRSVICFVKYYDTEFKGEKVRRLPALKTYIEDELQKETSNWTSAKILPGHQSTSAPHEVIDTDKGKLVAEICESQEFTPTGTKVLQEMTTPPTEADTPASQTAGAKRRIEFGSTAGQTTYLASCVELVTADKELPATTPPPKKAKNAAGEE